MQSETDMIIDEGNKHNLKDSFNSIGSRNITKTISYESLQVFF